MNIFVGLELQIYCYFNLHCSLIIIKHVKFKIYHLIRFCFAREISTYILYNFIYGFKGPWRRVCLGPYKKPRTNTARMGSGLTSSEEGRWVTQQIKFKCMILMRPSTGPQPPPSGLGHPPPGTMARSPNWIPRCCGVVCPWIDGSGGVPLWAGATCELERSRRRPSVWRQGSTWQSLC